MMLLKQYSQLHWRITERQLEQKDKRIRELMKQLENSKKLCDYYKGNPKNAALNNSDAVEGDLQLDEVIVKAVSHLLSDK